MNITNKIKKFIYKLIAVKCNKCEKGRIYHSHTELINNVNIEIYECNNCNNQYI